MHIARPPNALHYLLLKIRVPTKPSATIRGEKIAIDHDDLRRLLIQKNKKGTSSLYYWRKVEGGVLVYF